MTDAVAKATEAGNDLCLWKRERAGVPLYLLHWGSEADYEGEGEGESSSEEGRIRE